MAKEMDLDLLYDRAMDRARAYARQSGKHRYSTFQLLFTFEGYADFLLALPDNNTAHIVQETGHWAPRHGRRSPWNGILVQDLNGIPPGRIAVRIDGDNAGYLEAAALMRERE